MDREQAEGDKREIIFVQIPSRKKQGNITNRMEISFPISNTKTLAVGGK